MKTKLFSIWILLIVCLNAAAQGKLLFSSEYTSSNVLMTFCMGKVEYGSAIPNLWNIKIYEDVLYEGSRKCLFRGTNTVNGRKARIYGNINNDGTGMYFVVFDDYTLYEEYKTSLMGITSVTRTEYYMGNRLAMLQGGNSSGYNYGGGNSYGGSSSTQSQGRDCGVCSGKGWIVEYATDYGNNWMKYCPKCKKDMLTNHYHANCKNCNGTGRVY